MRPQNLPTVSPAPGSPGGRRGANRCRGAQGRLRAGRRLQADFMPCHQPCVSIRSPGPSDARGTRTPLQVKSPVGFDKKKSQRIWGLKLCFHLVSFGICSWSALRFSEVLIPWKISISWKFPPYLNKKGSLLPGIIDQDFYPVPPTAESSNPN